MHVSRRDIAAAVAGALISGAALGLGGCAKYNEPFKDAPVSGRLSNPAVIGEMPDGFSNWASKCDRSGHRVFTTYHGDHPYGAIAVIADPSCGKPGSR